MADSGPMPFNKYVPASDKDFSFDREVTLEPRDTILMLVVASHRLCSDFARPKDRIVRLTLSELNLLAAAALTWFSHNTSFPMTKWLRPSCLFVLIFICNSNDFLYRW